MPGPGIPRTASCARPGISSAALEEPAQRQGVAHGVAVAVVVEVRVDLAAAVVPLPDPVGPPGQVLVRVGAGVEVVVVGAVEADVDERALHC